MWITYPDTIGKKQESGSYWNSVYKKTYIRVEQLKLRQSLLGDIDDTLETLEYEKYMEECG